MNEKLEEARKVNAECQQFTELERKAADKRHEESIEMRQILQEQIDQQKALKVHKRIRLNRANFVLT